MTMCFMNILDSDSDYDMAKEMKEIRAVKRRKKERKEMEDMVRRREEKIKDKESIQKEVEEVFSLSRILLMT